MSAAIVSSLSSLWQPSALLGPVVSAVSSNAASLSIVIGTVTALLICGLWLDDQLVLRMFYTAPLPKPDPLHPEEVQTHSQPGSFDVFRLLNWALSAVFIVSFSLSSLNASFWTALPLGRWTIYLAAFTLVYLLGFFFTSYLYREDEAEPLNTAHFAYPSGMPSVLLNSAEPSEPSEADALPAQPQPPKPASPRVRNRRVHRPVQARDSPRSPALSPAGSVASPIEGPGWIRLFVLAVSTPLLVTAVSVLLAMSAGRALSSPSLDAYADRAPSDSDGLVARAIGSLSALAYAAAYGASALWKLKLNDIPTVARANEWLGALLSACDNALRVEPGSSAAAVSVLSLLAVAYLSFRVFSRVIDGPSATAPCDGRMFLAVEKPASAILPGSAGYPAAVRSIEDADQFCSALPPAAPGDVFRAREYSASLHEQRDPSAFPGPYPNGWYKLASSDEVAKGAFISVKALGQNLVVFRGSSGRIGVLDAYCPHLGAHLGVGSTVVGDSIVCPFHGWQFDTEGHCTHIPYCDRPPKYADTRSWHAVEYYGAICVYFDAEGRAPPYQLPSVPEIDCGRWVYRGRFKTFVKMHIQDFAENSADAAHFNQLHARMYLPLLGRFFSVHHETEWGTHETDKHICWFSDHATLKLFGKYPLPFTSARAHVSFIGPGGVVRFHFFTPRGEILLFKTFLPLEPFYQQVEDVWFADRDMPKPLVSYVVRNFFRAFRDDIFVWENKTYLRKPMLVSGDGPMPALRRWYRQFYSKSSAAPLRSHCMSDQHNPDVAW